MKPLANSHTNIGLNNQPIEIPADNTRKPRFADSEVATQKSIETCKSAKKNSWRERTPEKTSFLETLAPFMNKIGKDDLLGK